MVITREIALRAVLCGACKVPEVGRPVSDLSQSALIWAEDAGIAEGVKAPLPIWVLSGSGSGDGDGDGDGLVNKKDFLALLTAREASR